MSNNAGSTSNVLYAVMALLGELDDSALHIVKAEVIVLTPTQQSTHIMPQLMQMPHNVAQGKAFTVDVSICVASVALSSLVS